MSNVKRIYHYTYQITHIPSQKRYIGVRSSKNLTPEEDLGFRYFSSSTDLEFMVDQKNNPDHYCYEVMSTHDTREEAAQQEIDYHTLFDVGLNPTFYNKMNALSSGLTFSPEILQQLSDISTELWKDPEYRKKQERSPEMRQKKSKDMIELYKNRPELGIQIGKSVREYQLNNPEVVLIRQEKTRLGLIKHYKENPDSGKLRGPAVTAGLKKFFEQNPEARDDISKRMKKFWTENPDIKEERNKKTSKSNTEFYKDPKNMEECIIRNKKIAADYRIRLKNMSDEEFEEYLEGRTDRAKKKLTSTRNAC